jgi:hypothetical protein
MEGGCESENKREGASERGREGARREGCLRLDQDCAGTASLPAGRSVKGRAAEALTLPS